MDRVRYARDEGGVMADHPEPLMTVAEVAEYLRVSPAFVRQDSSGLRQPTIPSVKIGGAVRFRRAAVQAFVEQMERVGREIPHPRRGA